MKLPLYVVKHKIVSLVFMTIILVIVGVLGYLIHWSSQSTHRAINAEEVPKIKYIGLNLEPYNSQTKQAGDIIFTKSTLGEQGLAMIDYGYVVPASSAGPAKTNPQPTFVAPLGTKVGSLIDGQVIKVEQIYSGDYTIHVAKSRFANYIYETEHVINPIVKVGDKVMAGQTIAEVSDYDKRNIDGNGVLEIGILLKGKPNAHICPYLYLDPSIKEQTYASLRNIYAAWNDFRGQEVYDLNQSGTPGCVTTETVFEN